MKCLHENSLKNLNKKNCICSPHRELLSTIYGGKFAQITPSETLLNAMEYCPPSIIAEQIFFVFDLCIPKSYQIVFLNQILK
jgi:hypothetical protein